MENREIKFRAWIKAQERFAKDGFTIDYAIQDSDYILMQYIGLKDKNGVKIYEGDVMDNDGLMVEVAFVGGAFCKCNDVGQWLIIDPDECKVIGNIYENPELLK